MLNRTQFIEHFKTEVMPTIRTTETVQGGGRDYPLRAETWNNLVDSMITDRQLPKCAANWSNPYDRRK